MSGSGTGDVLQAGTGVDRIPAMSTSHYYLIGNVTCNAMPVITNTFFFFRDDDDTGNAYADTADPCRKFQEFFLHRC